jgi:archaellum component FlaC
MLLFGVAIVTMTEAEGLIPDQLRHMRGAIDALCEDMREVKSRLGNLVSQFANLSRGLEGLDTRLERIERRLAMIERRC